MRRFIIIFGCVVFLTILWQVLSGWDYDKTRHIPGKVKVIVSQETAFGEGILFEDEFHGTFGVARVERKWGALYRYDGGAYGYSVEGGKPFQAAGIGTGVGEKKDRFVVGIKTAEDSKIKYIAIGGHREDVPISEPYSLTLEEARADGDNYQIKEVKDQYALFVFDDYSEDTWTIRAFDENGRLVAHKLFPGDEKYIDW